MEPRFFYQPYIILFIIYLKLIRKTCHYYYSSSPTKKTLVSQVTSRCRSTLFVNDRCYLFMHRPHCRQPNVPSPKLKASPSQFVVSYLRTFVHHSPLLSHRCNVEHHHVSKTKSDATFYQSATTFHLRRTNPSRPFPLLQVTLEPVSSLKWVEAPLPSHIHLKSFSKVKPHIP